MTLSKKIFITFFIAVSLLLTVILYLIDKKAEQQEIANIISNLENAKLQFQRDFATEQTHIQTLTRIISSDQKFRSFLANIKDNFYPFTDEIGKDTKADFVFMLDDNQSVRAVYNKNPSVTLPLADYLTAFEIDSQFNIGTINSKIISLPNGLYSTHYVPLKASLEDEYPLALLVVINSINDARISGLLTENFQAVFFNQGQIVAKTTPLAFANAILTQKPTIIEKGQFIWQGQRYIAKHVLFNSQNPNAGYILSANLDLALLAFKELQQQIIWTGIQILIVGALLFLVLSRRITKPLRLMTQSTIAIQKGDYAHRISYKSRDEVGQLASAFNDMAHGLQEKEWIRSTFNKYVDPAIVTELLSQPDKLMMGGERRIQTVLFSDIAGFTEFSEKLPAEALVTLLNKYLTAMTAEISKQHGIIDKFIGDAIMAFWTPQLCGEHYAQYACLAALNMQTMLQKLRLQWLEHGYPKIQVRIGIATGEMIVGNIGSEQARSYTCIGDRVNYSSRLEGLNKYYGTQIIIDHQTALYSENLIYRELDTVIVKGRSEGEAIYELFGLTNQIEQEKLSLITQYQTALTLYRQGQFSKAAELFAHLSTDPPSQLMLKRCQQFSQQPPSDWQGIYSMTAK